MNTVRVSLRSKLALLAATLSAVIVGLGSEVQGALLLRDYLPILARGQIAAADSEAAALSRAVQSAKQVLEATAQSLVELNFDAPPDRALSTLRSAGAVFDLVALAEPGGRLTYLSTPQPGTDQASIGDRDYYRDALATTEVVVGAPILSKLTKEPAIPMAVAVRDVNRRVKGLLVGRLSLVRANLLSSVGESQPVSSWWVEVVTTEQPPRYLVHPEPARLLTSVDAGHQTLVDDQPAMRRLSSDPKGSVVAARHVPGLPWTVYVAQPAKQAFAPLSAVRARARLYAPFVALVSALVVWLAAYSFLAPLQRLYLAIRRSARDPDQPLDAGAMPANEVGRWPVL